GRRQAVPVGIGHNNVRHALRTEVGGWNSSVGRRVDDDFSDVGAAAEILLGCVDLVQVVPGGDVRADVAGAGEFGQLREVGAGVHRGADQAEVVQVEAPQVEPDHRTRHGAGDDPAGAVAEFGQDAFQPGAAHDVGHGVQAAGRRRAQLAAELVRVHVAGEGDFGTGGADRVGLVAAGQGQNPRAARGGKLDGGEPDATGGAGDEHRLVLLD